MGDVSDSGGSNSSSVVVAALFVLFAALPSFAAAQTTSVQTQELLPPGENACQMISVTSIEPHVYGGILESFDVTISDTSGGYVGVLATAGDTAIPLDYITRWAGTPSGMRIHVDTPDMPTGSALPISLTLLSSLPNQPTCITSISFDVSSLGNLVGEPTPVASTPQNNSYTYVNPTPTETTPEGSTANKPSVASGNVSNSGAATKGTQPGTTGSLSMQSGSSTAVLGAGVTAASNAKILSDICSGSNAYRLWFILLAIYIVIVALVVFAEPWFLEDSVLGSTASILVPLILLLAFWYFSATCRAAAWIPVAACVIAIVGLFLAFREYETTPLLPASTSS